MSDPLPSPHFFFSDHILSCALSFFLYSYIYHGIYLKVQVSHHKKILCWNNRESPPLLHVHLYPPFCVFGARLGLARGIFTSSLEFHFRRRLLQTSAVVLTNFCRGIDKLLPWRLETFAAVFTNFCRGIFRLLPWCSQTFAVVFSDFCRGNYKLFPCLPNRFFVSFKIKLVT